MKALVTGASRGLGWALARRLAAAHWDLVLASQRGADGELQIEAFLRLGAPSVVVYGADLAAPEAIERCGLLDEAGEVDLLVNNAAMTPLPALLESVAPESVARTVTLNLTVPVRLMQAALPGMKARGLGTILNVSSVCGQGPAPKAPRLTVYCATKAGLDAVSRAVAREVAGTGVRIVTAALGAMATDMRRRLGADEAGPSWVGLLEPSWVAVRLHEIAGDSLAYPNGARYVLRPGRPGHVEVEW